MLHFHRIALGSVAALALAACNPATTDNAATPASETAEADGQTIAAGLDANSKFVTAAKAAGLDATLAGPGPYTVLVPDDAAFDKLPAGALDGLMKPEAKEQLSGVLKYHILPGTILAADIGKAIDNGGGKAVLATMGGETLTATRVGDKVVLSDAAGTKSMVTAADERRSNGVVHRVDAVLMPS